MPTQGGTMGIVCTGVSWRCGLRRADVLFVVCWGRLEMKLLQGPLSVTELFICIPGGRPTLQRRRNVAASQSNNCGLI